MDKYDTLVEIFVAKAEKHEQADVRMALTVVAEVFRGIEQMGADLDRIATALEKIAERS